MRTSKTQPSSVWARPPPLGASKPTGPWTIGVGGARGVRGVAFSAKWVRMGALLRRRTGGREPPTRALLRLLKFKSAGAGVLRNPLG